MVKNRIKELRTQKKLTQQGLAMAIGCSQNQISKIESGKSEPTSSLLKSLAHFFKVSVDYLLCETDFRYKVDVSEAYSNQKFVETYARYAALPVKKQALIEDFIDALSPEEND